MVKTVFHYDKQCKTCGIKNVMPPYYLMWNTKRKYQRRKEVTLNAHDACRANGGAGFFAENFVCVDQNFGKTWNHLNEKTSDWLHHKYIDQMTRLEHKVLIETYYAMADLDA